jgi:hypothetical protein
MNHKEIMQALINGEKITMASWGIGEYTYLGEHGNLVNAKGLLAQLALADRYIIYKEPNWYDNIPEKGVLCWCWDDEEDNRYIDVVLGHRDDEHYKFPTATSSYVNAQPLTKEEVLELCLEK